MVHLPITNLPVRKCGPDCPQAWAVVSHGESLTVWGWAGAFFWWAQLLECVGPSCYTETVDRGMPQVAKVDRCGARAVGAPTRPACEACLTSNMCLPLAVYAWVGCSRGCVLGGTALTAHMQHSEGMQQQRSHKLWPSKCCDHLGLGVVTTCKASLPSSALRVCCQHPPLPTLAPRL